MNVEPNDLRQKAILEAAWTAFATYGFRKTSMDDIARGAGMSRPALYLHFRNKEDIFRSLAQYYYDEAAATVQDALDGAGPVGEVLARAFDVQGGPLIEAMLTSPHGLELLDVSTTAASDIAEAGEQRLKQVYAGWLQREADAGRIHLPAAPETVADAMTAALKGVKAAGTTYPVYKSRVSTLAALFGAGLAVKG